jgi:hypothetical protein
MKLHKIVEVILGIVLSSMIVNAQNEGRNKDLYLKGKWSGSCATEIIDHASIRLCELCPFEIDPIDKSKGRFINIELNFLSDSIEFNQNGKITTIPFKRNKDNHSFSFILNEKQYNFRMFLYEQQRIIEDGDGMILVLTKSKE